MENKIEIKIQTNNEITPTSALKEAMQNLADDCNTAISKFKVKLN